MPSDSNQPQTSAASDTIPPVLTSPEFSGRLEPTTENVELSDRLQCWRVEPLPVQEIRGIPGVHWNDLYRVEAGRLVPLEEPQTPIFAGNTVVHNSRLTRDELLNSVPRYASFGTRRETLTNRLGTQVSESYGSALTGSNVYMNGPLAIPGTPEKRPTGKFYTALSRLLAQLLAPSSKVLTHRVVWNARYADGSRRPFSLLVNQRGLLFLHLLNITAWTALTQPEENYPPRTFYPSFPVDTAEAQAVFGMLTPAMMEKVNSGGSYPTSISMSSVELSEMKKPSLSECLSLGKGGKNSRWRHQLLAALSPILERLSPREAW